MKVKVSPERSFLSVGPDTSVKNNIGCNLGVLKENSKVGSKGIPIGIPSYQVGGGTIHIWCLSVIQSFVLYYPEHRCSYFMVYCCDRIDK